jgi:hypothetical protein
MNIPLDRLYHYIENIASEIYGSRIIIYRFFPHGSKNINDLNNLYELEDDWVKKAVSPALWCHDQEPLDYEFYKSSRQRADTDFDKILKSNGLAIPPKNLNYQPSIFKKGFLLHSEKRSQELEKYQQDDELLPVYYWSHSIIARDWFRYAEHENFQKCTKNTFLIYNRAWSGTREYRLQFLNLLVERGLVERCQTSCNPMDPELNIHYTDHKFINPQWQPTHVLENFFNPTTADSTSSGDFNTNDYNSTDIEVVLETLFDTNRLHLTEKSLRPIACSQPFILAGAQGSLEYLRSYGFKTYSDVWDESYDQIEDSKKRLTAIVNLMGQIAQWDEPTKKHKLSHAQQIADQNRQWFFSQEFFNLIITELKTNLKSAVNELEVCNNYQWWINRWNHIMSCPEAFDYLKTNRTHTAATIETIKFVMKIAQNKLDKKSKIPNRLNTIK